MLQERNFPTFLKRLTPAPKLWLSLGLILSVILFENYQYSIGLILVSVVMIIREKQTTLFKFMLVTITVLFVSMYGMYGTIAPTINPAVDPVLFHVMGIPYYAKGLAHASYFFLRVAPLMCALFLLFLTIDTTDLGATMCQAGIPYHFVFTFIDSFQVITLLSKDMEQIRDAQCARGLKTDGNLIARFKAFVPIMVPVVANSIIKVQDQAIAMDTKGFNSTAQKTIYRELVPYRWDGLVKWLGIALAVAAVLYKLLAAFHIIAPFLSNIR